jgi:hypothetical protein
MTVFALVQTFLTSTILGVVIAYIDFKSWFFAFFIVARSPTGFARLEHAAQLHSQKTAED